MISSHRTLAVAAGLVLVFAACGGDDDAATATSSAATDTLDEAVTTTAAPDTTESESTAVPSTVPGAVNNGDDVADAGETVAVHYTGTLDDGEEFDSSRERDPLEFVIGSGQVIPGFDAAVAGLTIGETVTVEIPPEDAYGIEDPEAFIDFPIEDVPEDLRVVGLEVALGNGLPATVVAVSDDTVTIDANHPLAGEALTFEIELIEILS